MAAAAPESTASRGAGVAGGHRGVEVVAGAPSRATSAAAALSSTVSRTGPVLPSSRSCTARGVERRRRRRAARPPPTGGCPGRPGRRRSAGASRRAPPRPWRSSAVVSSSSPSSPRNTRAEPPRSAKTPATTGSMPRVEDADRLGGGRAGLVSGPRKLKTVGMPSSLARRPGEPQRRVVDRREAEGDAHLDGDVRGRRPGGRSSTTPRCSSTSAAPHEDDAARLPCLTTRAPAAAATIAAIVETLTVCAPVAAGADDVDDRARRPSSGVARSSIVRASPSPPRPSRPWRAAPPRSPRSGRTSRSRT